MFHPPSKYHTSDSILIHYSLTIPLFNTMQQMWTNCGLRATLSSSKPLLQITIKKSLSLFYKWIGYKEAAVWRACAWPTPELVTSIITCACLYKFSTQSQFLTPLLNKLDTACDNTNCHQYRTNSNPYSTSHSHYNCICTSISRGLQNCDTSRSHAVTMKRSAFCKVNTGKYLPGYTKSHPTRQ
jgi:hypothetical protein